MGNRKFLIDFFKKITNSRNFFSEVKEGIENSSNITIVREFELVMHKILSLGVGVVSEATFAKAVQNIVDQDLKHAATLNKGHVGDVTIKYFMVFDNHADVTVAKNAERKKRHEARLLSAENSNKRQKTENAKKDEDNEESEAERENDADADADETPTEAVNHGYTQEELDDFFPEARFNVENTKFALDSLGAHARPSHVRLLLSENSRKVMERIQLFMCKVIAAHFAESEINVELVCSACANLQNKSAPFYKLIERVPGINEGEFVALRVACESIVETDAVSIVHCCDSDIFMAALCAVPRLLEKGKNCTLWLDLSSTLKWAPKDSEKPLCNVLKTYVDAHNSEEFRELGVRCPLEVIEFVTSLAGTDKVESLPNCTGNAFLTALFKSDKRGQELRECARDIKFNTATWDFTKPQRTRLDERVSFEVVEIQAVYFLILLCAMAKYDAPTFKKLKPYLSVNQMETGLAKMHEISAARYESRKQLLPKRIEDYKKQVAAFESLDQTVQDGEKIKKPPASEPTVQFGFRPPRSVFEARARVRRTLWQVAETLNAVAVGGGLDASACMEKPVWGWKSDGTRTDDIESVDQFAPLFHS
jgi:predicted Holliday junction resolvase-like endonuclease